VPGAERLARLLIHLTSVFRGFRSELAVFSVVELWVTLVGEIRG
jgi:hypothetical protein